MIKKFRETLNGFHIILSTKEANHTLKFTSKEVKRKPYLQKKFQQ
jgi:hypothetical protein